MRTWELWPRSTRRDTTATTKERRRSMAKKSFWQRGEDYAKKVSSEIIDQIKRGVAPWQKP